MKYSLKIALTYLLYFISTQANAAPVIDHDSSPLEAYEQVMSFSPEAHYKAITPLSKTALHGKTPGKVLISRQEKSIFFNKEDTWRKEFSPNSNDNSSWWLEDNSYGNALITFINELSLVQFLRQSGGDANDLVQINKYIKQQDYYTLQEEQSFVPQRSALANDYISLIDLWHEYANTIIFILILMTGIRMLMPSIYQLLTFKKKHRRRRNNTIINTEPDNENNNAPTLLLTKHGRALKDSKNIAKTPIEKHSHASRQPIYQLLTFKKKHRRRCNNTIINTEPDNENNNAPTLLLTKHGRALKDSKNIAKTPIKEHSHASRYHHHSPHSHRRHRHKRSLLRKFIDFCRT